MTLWSEDWHSLWAAGAARPSHDELRALLGEVGRKGPLLSDVDARSTYRVHDVAAPVFRADGRVELAVAAATPPSRPEGIEMSGAEVLALGDRVMGAAQELTFAVHGRRPITDAAGM